MSEKKEYIRIRGAREHNLKNINIDIPRNEFVVLTGLSGSGKSSLAFDTIYAEGQRRYMESLSSYARQFLGQMEKPDVDDIQGLSPAISIDQKSTNRNPRSTTNEEAPEKSRGSLKKDTESMNRKELTEMIAKLTKKMNKAAAELNFEEAAELRDELKKYKIALRDYDD